MQISSLKWPDVLLLMCAIALLFLFFQRRTIRSDARVANTELGIEETIRRVQAELAHADSVASDKGDASLFRVKGFELELNFIVRKKNAGTAEADFQVVTVGGASEYGEETIQKIKLSMEVVPEQNDSVGPDSTLQ